MISSPPTRRDSGAYRRVDAESEQIGPSGEPALLDRLLATEVDLDVAFDRLQAASDADALAAAATTRRSVVPGNVFATSQATLATLLAQVLERYEDIEALIEGLREDDAEAQSAAQTGAIAVVSEEELGDPETLSRALAPLAAESARFEELFDTAKGALDRLDLYRLSRMTTDELVRHMRREDSWPTLQSLVEFLRSLHAAADTFEAMELPANDIRDYLRHLYSMRDWRELSRLVGVLELAASRLEDVRRSDDAAASNPSPGAAIDPDPHATRPMTLDLGDPDASTGSIDAPSTPAEVAEPKPDIARDDDPEPETLT
ncbi:MAG: hypothetical protein AAGN46_05720 [Acidobacteriota bacterium]